MTFWVGYAAPQGDTADCPPLSGMDQATATLAAFLMLEER